MGGIRTPNKQWVPPWRALTIALVFCLFCSFCNLAGATTAYCAVATDRVTIVAAGKAERCTHLARQYLRYLDVLRELAQWGKEFNPAPMRLYSLPLVDAPPYIRLSPESHYPLSADIIGPGSDEITLAKLLPGSSFDVAVILDGRSDRPLRAFFFSHAQSLFNSGLFERHPLWFQVGVPMLVNGMTIHDDGSVQFNRRQTFFYRLDTRGSRKRNYDLPLLLDAEIKSDAAGEYDWVEYITLSREWAQFCLLKKTERRARYRELADRLQEDLAKEEAVSRVFGMPLAQLAAEFQDSKWRQAQYHMSAPAQLPILPAPTMLDEEQLRGQMLILANRAAQLKLGGPGLQDFRRRAKKKGWAKPADP